MNPSPAPRARALAVLAALAVVAACEQPTEVGAPLARRDASGANVQSSSPGKSAKHGQIASRILLDNSGRATFEIRTGTFDAASGVGTPDGFLDKVKYRVVSASGKKVVESDVRFEKKATPTSSYSEVISRRDRHKDADDDDGPGDHALIFDPTYTVTVEAHLRGVAGDGKRTDVVRDTAAVFTYPDLDLRPQTPVQVGFGTSIDDDPGLFATSAEVKAGVPTVFQAVVTNSGPSGSSAVAAIASCSVKVFEVNANGTTGASVAAPAIPYRWWTLAGVRDATPPAAEWSSSTPILLPANDVAGCRFALSLDGVGTTKRVVVTVNNLSPGDYDTSNNSVTTDFNVVDYTPAQPPADGQALGSAYEVTTFDGPEPVLPGNFVGIVKQQLEITELSALLVDGAISSGTFTLRVKMGTAPALVNGNIDLAAVTPMADAEWTGTVASLLAATGGCLSSSSSGALSNDLPPANLGQPTHTICVDPVAGGLLRLRVLFNWTSTSVGVPGGTPFGKFVRFNVGLTFSDYADHLGANANLKLTDLAFNYVQAYGTPGYTFGTCPPGPDPCPRTIMPYVEALRVQSP